jgi:ribonuclease Z
LINFEKGKKVAEVIILGSGFAVPDEIQDNTHLLISQGKRVVLVDTASNPILRLRKAGIRFDDLSDLILTHFHPDHVSGVPLLLMGMWLLGRKRSLDIYGFDHTIDRVQKMIGLYDLFTWPNFYPVHFHSIPEEEMAPVIEDEDLRITASPVKHLIPTLGLRVSFIPQGRVMAYSCDTEPCIQVERLAEGADVLIHEAAGASKGHTSPEQAAQIARQANVKRLYLIHYSQSKTGLRSALDAARKIFPGPVMLTEDFQKIDF